MSRRFHLFLWLIAAAVAFPVVARGGPSQAQRTEAAAISQVAAAKAASKEYLLCAELFHQAYRVDPSFLGYLYSAARCAQKGEKLDSAERDYRAFLARAPAENSLIVKAQRHLDELLETRAKASAALASAPKTASGAASSPVAASAPASSSAAVESGAGPGSAPGAGSAAAPAVGSAAARAAGPAPTTQIAASSDGSWRRPVGMGAMIGGGALLISGLTFAALGWMDRADLKRRLDKREGGLIVDITLAEAQLAEDDYRGRLRLGAALGGAGVVVAVVGAWLSASTPVVSARALPGGGTLLLTASWR